LWCCYALSHFLRSLDRPGLPDYNKPRLCVEPQDPCPEEFSD
jgi:hypothetical protein